MTTAVTAATTAAAVSDTAAQSSVVALAALVLLGSVIPVVPTGALVAAAAAYSADDGPHLVLVLLVAALAALAGDLVTYALLRSGAGRLAQRWTTQHGGERAEHVVDRLRERGVSLLVVSRLVPAGRLPVLLAAGIARLPWSSVVPAQAIGCGLWSLAYGLLGVLGGGLFSSPVVSALVAVALALLVNAVQALVARRRRAA